MLEEQKMEKFIAITFVTFQPNIFYGTFVPRRTFGLKVGR